MKAPTCESIVRRWTRDLEEPEWITEPCGLPAMWRVRAADTGVGIRICHRHARWWRSSRADRLRALVPFEVEAEPLEAKR